MDQPPQAPPAADQPAVPPVPAPPAPVPAPPAPIVQAPIPQPHLIDVEDPTAAEIALARVRLTGHSTARNTFNDAAGNPIDNNLIRTRIIEMITNGALRWNGMLESPGIRRVLEYCGVPEGTTVPDGGNTDGYPNEVIKAMKTRISGVKQTFQNAMKSINAERQQEVAAAVGQQVVAAVFQAGQQAGQQQQQAEHQGAAAPPEPATLDDVVDFIDNEATTPQLATLSILLMGPGNYTIKLL